MQGPEGKRFLSERADNLATVLHLAVETNKDGLVLDAIRRAAGDGWQSLRDRLDNQGRTALHLASESGEATDTVRWLLNWGADPNAMYEVEKRWNPLSYDYGITPLHLAAVHADAANMVSALLASDAAPEIARPIKTTEGETYWTAALVASRHAADLRVLTALAAGGADFTAVTNDHNNALHVAAAWDRPNSVIHFLIELGVSADKTNNEGQTPLHLAARFSSNPETVALLFDATDNPCAADSKERTANDMLRANDALSGDRALERRFHEICLEGN